MAAVVMRPTKAEQFDFLQLRHQLKDRIRMKKSRGSDAAHGCSVSSTTDDKKKKKKKGRTHKAPALRRVWER
ncbi:hypothetical protein ACFX10_003684 [Malus domestica]